jgi:hypothetical protein
LRYVRRSTTCAGKSSSAGSGEGFNNWNFDLRWKLLAFRRRLIRFDFLIATALASGELGGPGPRLRWGEEPLNFAHSPLPFPTFPRHRHTARFRFGAGVAAHPSFILSLEAS